MEKYRAIGLMSGSSLDGLDIGCCDFEVDNGKWKFELIASEVIDYPGELASQLKQLPSAGAKTCWELNSALGNFFGEQVKAFISKHHLSGITLVASHGHTIFHFPEKGFTVQIGGGAAIGAKANLPVVCDFRSTDIAYGGQGTPIVPIGDLLLFNDYKLCMNIGGIANISCKTAGGKSIVAFDICAANQVLNALSMTLGFEYDDEGNLACRGNLHDGLLQALNEVEYYHRDYPKSLDNSFSTQVIRPVLEKFNISAEDKLRTYTEHIALQIANHIGAIAKKENIQYDAGDKILITGGGAFNRFLVERIKSATGMELELPDKGLIKFKEAVVIALMGILRMRKEVNVLKSVTGASKDTIGGAVYLPS